MLDFPYNSYPNRVVIGSVLVLVPLACFWLHLPNMCPSMHIRHNMHAPHERCCAPCLSDPPLAAAEEPGRPLSGPVPRSAACLGAQRSEEKLAFHHHSGGGGVGCETAGGSAHCDLYDVVRGPCGERLAPCAAAPGPLLLAEKERSSG